MRNFGILVFLVLLGVLIYFLYKQVMYIVKAKWTYGGVKLVKYNIQPVSATLIIYFDIKNKGFLSATISEQDYNVYINDSFVSKVNNKNDTYIQARGVSRVPFMITVKLEDLLSAGINNITSLINKSEREKIKIRIQGKLTLKMSIFEFKKMDFDMTSTLKELSEETPEYEFFKPNKNLKYELY